MSIEENYQKRFDLVQTISIILVCGFLAIHFVLYFLFGGDPNSVFLYFAVTLAYILGFARMFDLRLRNMWRKVLELELRIENADKNATSPERRNEGEA
jgi:hypothetical protein